MNHRVNMSDGSHFLVDDDGFHRIGKAFAIGDPDGRFIQHLQTFEQRGVKGVEIHVNVDQIVSITAA